MAWRTSGAKPARSSRSLGQDRVPDLPFQRAAGLGRLEEHGPAVLRMRQASHVPLALEGVHHPARRALVEIELRREVVQGHPAPPHQRLQGIALGDRDVVAADPVTVAELVDPHQLRQGVVQRLGVPLQDGIGGRDRRGL